jgi:hypothetical protein
MARTGTECTGEDWQERTGLDRMGAKRSGMAGMDTITTNRRTNE